MTMRVDPALVERFRDDVRAAASSSELDDGLAVAVSGGADSLAVLLLANAAFPGVINAATVDHGLRPEAAAECAFVADVCCGLGVPHVTLKVEVRETGEGLQAAARNARRMALGNWCQWNRQHFVVTGHHADDQAETVLMRLARGSGVAGLSGIDRRSSLPWRLHAVPEERDPIPLTVIRPLLGWRRSELAAIVADAGLTAVDDPSNHNPRYDRTRFRALLETTDLLDPLRLATSARLCHDADDALGAAALMLQRLALDKQQDCAVLDVAALTPWHEEIMRRIVIDIFHYLGVPKPLRGAQIIRLLGLLHAGRTATLAGIKAVPRNGVWTFTVAPPRRAH